MSRLIDQAKEALATFARIGTAPAPIGGLALAAHQVVPATQAVVFLADADHYVNDPSRTRDLEDIRALLRTGRATLDMDEVAEYFRLFEREALLDALIQELQ